LTQDIEEERRILALAAQAGLGSIYDASRSSYASWRSRVLRFAQLLQEKEMNDIDNTLAERGKRYGTFKGHAKITQRLKAVLTEHVKERGTILDDDQAEALEMICHKLGRIVNGDPNYADSWVDIAGYAKLVADRLEGKEV
jgi:hypothetical protein